MTPCHWACSSLDDHEVVRTGLRALLEADQDIDVVGEAGTVADALARIPAAKPDVAILDVRLPDGSGVEVCREIRSTSPEIACVMLTSYADDEALIASIMAGAAGYVLKQVGSLDLIDTIRRAGAGQSLLDPSLTERVLDRLREGPKVDPRLASLTPQERRILDLIAEGYTNRQIADTMFLAEKTVKNYVSNLLAKLGMERRTQAATFAARLSERSTQESRERRHRHLTTPSPVGPQPGPGSDSAERSVVRSVTPRSRSACSSRARSCRGCSKRLGSVSIPRPRPARAARRRSRFRGRARRDGVGVRGERRCPVELPATPPERIERAALVGRTSTGPRWPKAASRSWVYIDIGGSVAPAPGAISPSPVRAAIGWGSADTGDRAGSLR